MDSMLPGDPHARPRPLLVVVEDGQDRETLAGMLRGAGYAVKAVATGSEAFACVEQETPGLVLLEVTAGGGSELLARLRARPKTALVPMIAVGDGTDESVDAAFRAGADDQVRRPLRQSEVLARVRTQLRQREALDDLGRRERDAQAVLDLTSALASTLDLRDILFTVVARIADVARADRCSIVLTGEQDSSGVVVATSDDASLRDLPIDLRNYPEIQEVLATGESLVIRDAAAHPLMTVVRGNERFRSLALVPIQHDERPLGVIFLRCRSASAIDEREIELVSTVANATAVAMRNARLLQTALDESEQSVFARVEAERRVQLFQRYADFFESSADGMIVIDRHGKVLFTNPRGREILGCSEAELVQRRFEELVAARERDRATRLLRGFATGVYPRGVDLEVVTVHGESLVLSVSFSSVLHEERAVLFSFRDVTQERRTAQELRATKEFLERVIDSSVDGIVSADLSGRILLFNRAAGRMFGYEPHDVVGKRTAEELYPAGVARDVMKRIRDPQLGGSGRLEEYRVEMLTAAGELLPVSLSAALIYENGVPVGSVGIFTDMREKLRMTDQIQRAQEALRAREKQAIIAELAGAAAHELNQPLTSVMGYAAMLEQLTAQDPKLSHPIRVIMGEAERMAEIVRKIGRMTHYETKSYVGSARILDLERAMAQENDE